jgi:outer membrane protein assembly factor BamD (BamD/ComL family)
MPEYRIRLVITLAVIVLLSTFSLVLADIQNLDQAREVPSFSQRGKDGRDKTLMIVGRIGQLADIGKCKEVQRAFNQLKTELPEIAGPSLNDLIIFLEAEILRCKGDFVKAAASYGRFMDYFPDSKFYDLALERQFQIAAAFLAGRERPILGIFKIKGYAEGVRIMEAITYRQTLHDPEGIAIKAAVAVAKSYQDRKLFGEAYYRWAEIHDQHRTNKLGKQALLNMARCRQALYRGHQYDTSDLIGRPLNPESYYNSARSCYQKFKQQYPEDADDFKIEQKLNEINEQLAWKQFEIGRYYQERGNMLSANLYYRMVLNRWPQTNTAAIARQMLVPGSGTEEKTQ